MWKLWLDRLRPRGLGSEKLPPATLDELVRREFGLKIKQRAFYDEAMTHASMLDGDTKGLKSNERLEFLGDTALDLTVASFLFREFPKDQEGALTQRKSQIVNRKTLNLLGEKMGLPQFIQAKMRRKDIQDSVVGNALEALIGAIDLDHGFLRTSGAILRMLKRHGADDKVHQTADFKSKLLHWTQRNRKSLDFIVVKEYVEDGDTRYDMEVRVDGAVFGVGSGRSKKLAEQHAAHHAWRTVYDRYIAQRGEESSISGEAAEKAIRAMPTGSEDGPRVRRRGPRGSGSRAKKESLSSAKPVGRGMPREKLAEKPAEKPAEKLAEKPTLGKSESGKSGMAKPASEKTTGGRSGRRGGSPAASSPEVVPAEKGQVVTAADSGAVRKDRVDRAARAERLARQRAERAGGGAEAKQAASEASSPQAATSENEKQGAAERKSRRRPPRKGPSPESEA